MLSLPILKLQSRNLSRPTNDSGPVFEFLIAHAQHTRHTPPHQVGKEYRPDYQSHANGRGVENAQSAAGRIGRPALRDVDERSARGSDLSRRGFYASANGKARRQQTSDYS